MGIMSLLLSLVAWVRSSLLLLSPYASPARATTPALCALSLSWRNITTKSSEIERESRGEGKGGRGSPPHFFLLLPILQSAVIPPPSVSSSLPLVMYKTYKWHTGALVSSGWGWLYTCSCVPSERVKCQDKIRVLI